MFRESKCIDAFTYLLLKLFPAGASGDYKASPRKAKVLGQLLALIAIAVKNNKKNQVYTFNRAMAIIQKYVLPDFRFAVDRPAPGEEPGGTGPALCRGELRGDPARSLAGTDHQPVRP
ncbi:MAG: hypothetical protein P4M11_15800 [Candidatus Pacebacteria bacterium]|nr:hypothetical protein [Candidatus Paceibacterota bacterium]